jgi:endonuclease/exonuclease/phosphatase family metal-dependent hydrolase
MRVATYNVRHGAPPGRGTDHRTLREALGSLRPDVLALQELDRRVARSGFGDQPRIAARATGLEARFAPTRTLGPFGTYGNALLLPGAPLEHEVLRLRSAGEQRNAIFIRTAVGSLHVTVVCTHLQNSAGGGPGEAPAQLDEVLDELVRWSEPWVLMGDLNLTEAAVVLRFERAGLQPVPTGPTFPSPQPRVRIDWIGVRGLTVGSVEVPRLGASDHLPIVAELGEP